MKGRLALLACAATLGMALSGGSASAAMPNGLQGAQTPSHVDQVRWVCNPWGRCWWRPNYGYYGPAYGYYGGPRYYGGGWGWRRGWGGGGWHGGWHRHW